MEELCMVLAQLSVHKQKLSGTTAYLHSNRNGVWPMTILTNFSFLHKPTSCRYNINMLSIQTLTDCYFVGFSWKNFSDVLELHLNRCLLDSLQSAVTGFRKQQEDVWNPKLKFKSGQIPQFNYATTCPKWQVKYGSQQLPIFLWRNRKKHSIIIPDHPPHLMLWTWKEQFCFGTRHHCYIKSSS